MNMTTATKKTEVTRNWHHIDAKEEVLGRLAVKVAHLLMGKHKVNYAPYLENGDMVVITNAKHIQVTGAKETDKKYYGHSQKVGNLRTDTIEKLRVTNPNRIIMEAVKGMLPKNRLQDVRMSHLKIFAGATHPHEAQINSGKSKSKISAEENK